MTTRNVCPNANSEGSIGTTALRWATAFIDTLTLTNAATVANGGTGKTTSVAYSVQCGGTTTTSAHQDVVSVGSSGQVLTSNGASALPTWQATPSRNWGMDITANVAAYIP